MKATQRQDKSLSQVLSTSGEGAKSKTRGKVGTPFKAKVSLDNPFARRNILPLLSESEEVLFADLNIQKVSVIEKSRKIVGDPTETVPQNIDNYYID